MVMSETAPSPYNKNNPFLAKITENRLLSKAGSIKDTRHFVIDLEGSDWRYEPGWSLAVFPQNPAALVGELIVRLNLDANSDVPQKDGSSKPLRRVLLEDVALNRVSKKFVKTVAGKLP